MPYDKHLLENLSPELKIQWLVMKKKEELTKKEQMLLLAVRVSDTLETPSLEILSGYVIYKIKRRKEASEDKGSPFG